MRHKTALLSLLFLWLISSLLLVSLAGSVADIGAGFAIGLSGSSLKMLAYWLGAVLLAWSVAYFLATWLSSASLGLGLLATARAIWPDFEGVGAGTQKDMDRQKPLRVSLGVLAALVTVMAGVAGWLLVQVAERVDGAHRPDIIAHRGASSEAPENSLAAIELAMEQGADWVEIDVQQTSDNRIVVLHDSDLMKMAGVAMKVKDSTLAQLQSVEFGSRFGDQFTGEVVPSLEQVLRLVRNRCGLIIELKYYGGESGFEAEVARIVEQEGVEDQVQFMSLNLAGVRALKSLRPGWRVGLLSSVVVGDIRRFEVDFFAVNARKSTRRFVRQANAAGRPVYTWTINDSALMSTMAGREVDGIITDYPERASQVLAERRELGLHELLIINASSILGSRLDVAQ